MYVRIKRAPLIVFIDGGSVRSVPWNREFTLDASKSKDPVGDNPKLTFHWSCKIIGDSGDGGCFGGGEKLTYRKGEKITKFREKILLEGRRYLFTVTATDNDLSQSYSQEIEAISGKPPLVRLR